MYIMLVFFVVFLRFYSVLLGYIRNDFVPFQRPGFVDENCYNGQKKADHADKSYLTRGRIGPFKRCEVTDQY